ncbi:major facilitator superfamily MFS_1 [Chlorella sorokiniana]|uniref:Major facilitator superfamily MFS_1 n=1 Tax=Chlorella sorokiniana TaxID=3076 RepID=A0A2P6TXR5_CHLSO|nr:major facilitator superfamily MFS_1 [Chlorella sorokiniana]|eukprot:PRW58840.1 major facilitator superfamily MFS_1 [Chlorella sorokiniana]
MAGEPGSGGGAAPAGGASEPPNKALEQTHGLRDYYRVLAANRQFRYLWCAEMIDNIGSWLSYVATLELVEQFSGGSGLAISGVVIIRFLPSLLLAPVCGVVADRVNRVGVLVVAAVIDAAVVCGLAAVPLVQAGQVAVLYALLALQFSAAAFYEPARKALVPVLVPADQLHLATTIDSFAWSITGAVGASVGGVVASRLGVSACFLVDAVTYLVAAWFAYGIPRELGAPDAVAKQLKKFSSMRQVELTGALGHEEPAPAGSHRPHSRSSVDASTAENGSHHAGTLTHAEHRHHHSPERKPKAWEPAGLEPAADLPALQEQEGASTLSGRGSGGSNGAAAGAAGQRDGGGAALLAAATGALAEGVRALQDGWAYMRCRENRDVAALVLMKCAAALTWGAVDILNVKFSQMKSMQWAGDSSTTLGLIFATVGLGCFVGPVLLNHLFPPYPASLRWGVAASYCLFFAGFALMLIAPNISLVLASTFVRAMGSAVLWVYSTLLMQQRVPNDYLGRISALEGAAYTIAESASSVFGGAAFDVLRLSLHHLLLILTTMAGVMAVGWSLYAWVANRSKAGARAGYLPVRQSDEG